MGASQSNQATRNVVEEELLEDIRNLKINESPGFFNRKDELKELIKVMSQPPRSMGVLIGPKDSGKSKLLTHFRDLWNQTNARKVLAPMILINMRVRDCSTPEAFVLVLKEELQDWLVAAQAVVSTATRNVHLLGIPVGDIATSLKAFQDQVSGNKSALASIQDTIARFLARHRNMRPIIIIDEANLLSDWEQSYGTELSRLFGFLEALTKEQAIAHVIMASSDGFYRSWLRTKLTNGKVMSMGIGYFSEGEAKQFFSEFCIPSSGLTLEDDWEQSVWPIVYSAAGGSPYLLQCIVDSAARSSSLQDGANALIELEVLHLQEVDGGERWSQAEFRGIIMAIVDNDGVVNRDVVVKTVFGEDKFKAYTVFKELVRDNLLHVRVMLSGCIYKDVTHTGSGEFLVAITPCSLAAMRRIVA